MTFTVRNGGKVHVRSMLGDIKVGKPVEVYKEYHTKRGTNTSLPCWKTVRKQDERPYIHYDGVQIFLDRPDPEVFLGDIFDGADEIVDVLTVDVLAAAMADKDEVFIATEDAVYKISGLRLGTSVVSSCIVLTPLKKWKNLKSEILADPVRFFLRVKEGKWQIIYMGELGQHPYTAAEQLR